MADRREVAGHSPGAANGVAPGPPAPSPPDRERVLLLECRLEQLRAALADARDEADHARIRLAEAAARDPGHVCPYGLLHDELADARAEVAALHRRLERSEALRAELEAHLFGSGDPGDAGALIRLQREAVAERQRALMNEREVARLRRRVESLLASRDTLHTRIAEWHRLVSEDGAEAADLAEFMAGLRREILDLERRNVASEARETALRERLALAGLDAEGERRHPRPVRPPPVGPAASVVPAPARASGPAGAVGPAEALGPPPSAAGRGPSGPAPAVPEPGGPHDGTASKPADAEPAPSQRAGQPDRAASAAEAIEAAEAPAVRCEILLRLGRSADADALDVIRPWTGSAEPAVRAAAYEALGRLLERDASALLPHLLVGLDDPDARVRRRVVLAAATARGLALRPLLEPLREDPDPQVRRVVREVLRHTPPAPEPAPGGGEGRPEGTPRRRNEPPGGTGRSTGTEPGAVA